MKIVFLDGVLNNMTTKERTELGFVGIDHRLVPLLNDVIESSGAHVVISSTWRTMYNYSRMGELLSEAGFLFPSRIIGQTPHLGTRRGIEIQRWIDVHTKLGMVIESFAIIDDKSDMEHLLPRLAQTNFNEGMTEDTVQKTLEILSRSYKRKRR